MLPEFVTILVVLAVWIPVVTFFTVKLAAYAYLLGRMRFQERFTRKDKVHGN